MSRWLSVEEIRKQQRMRRQRVIEAMDSGSLPFEQRGRARYARQCDVEAWELTRLKNRPAPRNGTVRPELARFL